MSKRKEEHNLEFMKDPRVISNYTLLHDLGVFTELEHASNLIRHQDLLIEESFQLFESKSVNGLLDKLISIFLDKFIPEHMVVVTQKELDPDGADIHYFEHMKPADCNMEIRDFREFRNYFSLVPEATSFDVFSYCMENPEITDKFLFADPEFVIPLIGLESVYGFIVFGKKTMGGTYSDDELVYIRRILKYASISLQNLIHYQRAIFDAKTRLFNFSYFSIRFREELFRVSRHKAVVSVMLLDIDFFKKFNDTYGHLAGDDMLVHIADMIRESVRMEDIAARFGGEEFIVLLIQCDEDNAYTAAERLRQNIERTPLKNKSGDMNATVSIGVTTIREFREGKEAENIKNADTALYQSKKNGRNKTTIFRQGMQEEDKKE